MEAIRRPLCFSIRTATYCPQCLPKRIRRRSVRHARAGSSANTRRFGVVSTEARVSGISPGRVAMPTARAPFIVHRSDERVRTQPRQAPYGCACLESLLCRNVGRGLCRHVDDRAVSRDFAVSVDHADTDAAIVGRAEVEVLQDRELARLERAERDLNL